MSKITIIGNTFDSIQAIETLRQHNPQAEITLFCPEGVLPYDRSLLPSWAAKHAKEQQLFLKPEKYFTEHKVKVVLGDTLARISSKRKNITGESKQHYAFDQLLLCDVSSVQLPAIKGCHKKGVFNPYLYASVKELIKYLPFIDNAVVDVQDFAGFDMACALKELGKDVLMLIPKEGLLPEVFDEESGVLLKQIVEAKGIRVVMDGLDEVLGDSEVKAVKLSSGKVMAAQLVVLGHSKPELKGLAESGLLVDGQVGTTDYFQTQCDGIFACGSVTGGYTLSEAELKEEGLCAAHNMISQDSKAYAAPLVSRDFGLKICEGYCAGMTRLLEGGRERMQFDGPNNIYKKLYLYNDCLVGAILFNSAKDKPRFAKALAEKQSLAGNEEQFLHA